jgi:hypothetical protein
VKRAASAVETPAKRGRPVGSASPVSTVKHPRERQKTFDYSRWKVVFQRPSDFYQYLAGYPDKTGLMGYVFRLRPRIDHSLVGNDETHILQTNVEADLTEDRIGEMYGRGLYMCTLNDANRPKGQTEVCRTWFDCATAMKPPQYDPRTLCLGDPKNQDEISRLLNTGVFVRDSNGAPRLRNENDAPVAPVAAAAPAGGSDLFGRDVMGQVLLGLINRGSANPHDTVKDTIEIAKLLVPPAPPVDMETMIERVVTRLQGPPAPAGGLDAFATYERIDGFLSKFRGPAGGDGVAAAGGPVVSAAAHVPAIIAGLRGLVPELMDAWRFLRAEQGPPAGAAPVNGGVQMTLDQRIEEVVKLGFQRMTEGVSGFDYAAYTCMYVPGGLEVYRTLEPVGAVGLLAMAAMRPATRGVVNDPSTRAQLEAFLSDFFSFDPSGGELPGSPAPAAAG